MQNISGRGSRSDGIKLIQHKFTVCSISHSLDRNVKEARFQVNEQNACSPGAGLDYLKQNGKIPLRNTTNHHQIKHHTRVITLQIC